MEGAQRVVIKRERGKRDCGRGETPEATARPTSDVENRFFYEARAATAFLSLLVLMDRNFRFKNLHAAVYFLLFYADKVTARNLFLLR